MSKEYSYPIQIFFEDTDHSGLVYHPNYLKYFERARQNVIGVKNMSTLWQEKGLVPAIYQIDIKYVSGTTFGEELEIKSTYEFDGPFRMVWNQEAWNIDKNVAAAKGRTEIVTFNSDHKLVQFPSEILDYFNNEPN